jgi:hypothetical protein
MSGLARRREPGGLEAKSLLGVRGRTDGTTAIYRGAVRGYVAWSESQGVGLSVETLAEYLHHLKAQRARASRVNTALYGVKAAMLQAAKRGGMSARELAVIKTALDEIKGKQQGAPEIRVISPEERKRLFGAMPQRVRLISTFLNVTGARVSEALQREAG